MRRVRRAAVTGGASGIGRALLLALAAPGVELVGIDRDAAAAREVQRELEAAGAKSSWLVAELSADAGLERVEAELAPVDLLVHSAGVNAVGRFGRADIRDQCAVLDVNLRAPLQLTRALLAHDKLRPGGAIVFVASLSHYVGYPGAAVYAASKDGLASYARSLSVALAPAGIRVLAVFPGPTRTPHAREHAPPGRSERGRMPPERVAAATLKALERDQNRLVPGVRNRIFARLGRLFPGMTRRLLRRGILDAVERGP